MPKHLTTLDEATLVTTSELGVANGVAQLDGTGKVPTAQLPTIYTGAVSSVNGQVGNVVLTATNVSAVATSAVGAASGVAQLDSTTRLPAAQLPTTALVSGQLGVANGIATLDGTGHLTAGQLNAPVTSVNTQTGAVSLTAANVGAVATSARGTANGVASLDTNTLVPIAQIPSLAALYQQIPASTPTAGGQFLTSVASGSNSTQWTAPMVYTAASLAAMPATAPNGALCTRTDTIAVYVWSGGWQLLPYVQAWRTLPLKSPFRGFNNGDPTWLPQIRRIGARVYVRGRVELSAGGNITTTQTAAGFCTLPSDCVPSRHIDAVSTATVGTSGTVQDGSLRYQIDGGSANIVAYLDTTGPYPLTPWMGVEFAYWVD